MFFNAWFENIDCTTFSLLECLPAYPSDFCGDRTYQRLARASSRDPIQILCLQ